MLAHRGFREWRVDRAVTVFDHAPTTSDKTDETDNLHRGALGAMQHPRSESNGHAVASRALQGW